MKKKIAIALGIASTGSLLAREPAPPPADDATAPAAVLPDLIVTGQLQGASYSPPAETGITGLPAPIKELPLTVNTVSEDFLNDVSARRVRDLVGYIPGVNASEDSGATGDLLNIRGFDFIYQSYVNGMRNRLALQASREFSNIERVEIFKGPGGVEFGAGDPGGFVNYVTKKPQARRSVTLGTEIGSYDYYGAYLDATGPLWTPDGAVPSSDDDAGAFYRLILSADTAGSFRDAFDSERVMVAPSVLWNYADESSVLVEFQYGYHDQPYDRGIFYMEGAGFKNNFAPISRSYHEPDDYLQTNDTRTSVYWTHKLNENASLRVTGEVNTTDIQGDAVRSPYLFLLYNPGTNEWNGDSTLLRTPQRIDGSHYSYGIKPEVLMNFETGGMEHTGLLGMSYLFTNTNTKSQDGFLLEAIDLFDPVYGLPPVVLPPADPTDPDSIPANARDFRYREELEEYGIYYQHKLDVTKRVHLLGGLRYDWFDDASAVTRNQRAVPLGSLQGFSDQNLSWRLGAVGDINEMFTLFAGYSSSYQPQSGMYAGGGHAEALEATSFEGGVKASFLDGKLQSTVSIYQIERKNLLETDPNDPTGSFVVPVGTVDVRGIEWETTGRVTDDLTVQGGFAVMDSKLSDTLDPSVKGNEFYNVPNVQAGLRVRYDTSRWLVEGLSAGAGVVHVGNRAGDAANSFTLPDYTRFDAGLYYHWHDWNFKFTCENVFNKTYYLASQGYADIIQPGAPRLFTLGAEVTF